MTYKIPTIEEALSKAVDAWAENLTAEIKQEIARLQALKSRGEKYDVPF